MRVGPQQNRSAWRKPALAVATALFLTTTMPAHASEQAMIEALKAEIAALTARLDAIEEKATISTQVYSQPSVSAPPQTAASWADNIKLKGDFRYRHESFDIEDRTDRHRQRIRARAEMKATITDTVSVGFGLASGGSDPISTNQTLDDGASSKGVVIDLAYVNWKAPIEGLSVVAGKFKNLFHRAGGNGLIWDGDLRPEGVGAQYENGNLFANAMGLWIDESSSGEDALMLGGQFGINSAVGDGKLLSGVGYYHYTDAEDRPTFFEADEPQGNLTNPDGTYLSDFHLLEGFLEYQFAVDSNKVTVFADYVKNVAADDFDTAWALGAKLKRDDWSFGWTYQDVEADSVLGTFADSDFIGGGTDGKGHILQAGYSISKQIGLKGTLFLNDRNVDFGSEEEFKRLMLDISFKY